MLSCGTHLYIPQYSCVPRLEAVPLNSARRLFKSRKGDEAMVSCRSVGSTGISDINVW